MSIHAATNRAMGGYGGFNNGSLSGGDGTGTGEFIINTVHLALVKEARDLAGTLLPDGSRVSPGQTLYFVLYVDNPSTYPAKDIQLTDLLNESEFSYIPDSLETAVVASGSDDAAIWAGNWTALSDDVGGGDDIASITDSGGTVEMDKITIGAVAGQANAAVTVSGNTLRAFRFRVTVK